jgi:hypothetical protein
MKPRIFVEAASARLKVDFKPSAGHTLFNDWSKDALARGTGTFSFHYLMADEGAKYQA